MVGSFLTRILVMVFGYAYPAYECFKTVEKNKLEIEQLRFWCQYWILIAVITVLERVGDTFLSWLPMYSEAKLAFVIYLWYPKTKGTTYVYDSFFRPYLAKHETEIDRNLLEVRARCADYAVLYWQKAATYGQTRVFEILQYVSAQSTKAPQPTQQRPAPSIPTRQPAAVTEEKPQQPPTRTSSTGRKKLQTADPAEKSQQLPTRTVSGGSTGRNKLQNEPPPPAAAAAQEAVVSSAVAVLVPAATTAGPQVKKEADDQPTTTSESSLPKENVAEEMESELGSSYEIVKAPPKETVMEETIRETRVRLRKTRSAGVR